MLNTVRNTREQVLATRVPANSQHARREKKPKANDWEAKGHGTYKKAVFYRPK